MPLAIFLCEIFKIVLGWSRRYGEDRYTLWGERWHSWQISFRQLALRVQLFERLFGGRELDGYFVQLQSPGFSNFSGLEADRPWTRASSEPTSAKRRKTPHFCRPAYLSLPVDTSSLGDVC